jgi:hypothetical protein
VAATKDLNEFEQLVKEVGVCRRIAWHTTSTCWDGAVMHPCPQSVIVPVLLREARARACR